MQDVDADRDGPPVSRRRTCTPRSRDTFGCPPRELRGPRQARPAPRRDRRPRGRPGREEGRRGRPPGRGRGGAGGGVHRERRRPTAEAAASDGRAVDRGSRAVQVDDELSTPRRYARYKELVARARPSPSRSRTRRRRRYESAKVVTARVGEGRAQLPGPSSSPRPPA